MEATMFTSFTDMELEDLSYIDHLMQVNSSLEDIFGPPCSEEDTTYHQQETNNYNQVLVGCKRSSPQVIDHHTIIVEETPFVKQHKPNNWNLYNKIDDNHALISQEDDYSNLNMLSFSSNSLDFSQKCIPKASSHFANKRSGSTLASLSSSKDHILAERKRREKLNQRFIALTATIPGLTKMDKASVLGDALKYVKQLEEQVKKLEEVSKTKSIESAVLVKRSRVFEEEEGDQCSTYDAISSGGSFDGPLHLEIEAKFSNKDVLIRIHCEKKVGVIEKLISHIENIHLVVINSSALIFGCASIDATIIAQMDAEFSMTIEDLVRDLHVTLKHLM